MAIDIIARGMIEESCSGETVDGESSYTLTNAVDFPLMGLNLYGKSVQDGEPTPDAPVDIVSVGDSGNITIMCEDQNGQSLTAEITSALPFCGIPVKSGGNYTESSGQQWFCDELIYNADGTGKIIKMCSNVKLSSANIIKRTQSTAGTAFFTNIIGASMDNTSSLTPLSNYFLGVPYGSANLSENRSKYRCFLGSTGTLALENPANDDSKFATLEDMKNFVDNNDVYIVYPLAEPQEIELTAAEVAALKALQTFDGTTGISNSADADMSVKYCTSKAFSEFVLPITKGLQSQIDELRAAVLSLGGNV